MVALLAVPTCGLAAESSAEAYAEVEELSARVEQTGQEYDAAVARQQELQTQIEELDAKAAELGVQLEAQREISDACIVAQYKHSGDTNEFLVVVCNSEEFTEVVNAFDYYNRVNEYNTEQIEETIRLQEELEQTQADLETAKAEADEAAAEAEAALAEAQAAREEAQARAEALAAEEAAAAASAAASETPASAPAESDMNNSANTATSIDSSVSAGNVSSGDVDWSQDKAAFVAEWAPRIDAYLAGSPTAGLGTAYASAAWDYSVDPRWAPAISEIESSKGANCFRPYNAWGFFNKPPNFTSWEDGIGRVTRSLSRSYGGYLTYEGACRYCPSDPDGWYNNVSAEMAKI